MALLPVQAPTDQFQNFPADCQMRYDGLLCSCWPTMAGPPSRCPSPLPIRLILHMFPRWEHLPESFPAIPGVSRTRSLVFRSWYSHPLVLLYHLNLPVAQGVEWLCHPPPLLSAFLSVLRNHPVMLIRQYMVLRCVFP